MKHALLLIVCLFAGVGVQADDGSLMQRIMEDYAFTQWGGTTRRNYARLVPKDWSLPELQLPTNALESIHVVTSKMGDRKRVFVAEGDRTILRIDVEVCSDVEAAHRTIMDQFANMTTTYRYPRLTNEIADVLFFKDWGSRSFMTFARNNVYVSLRSNMAACQITNVASQIDTSILYVSTNHASSSGHTLY